MSNDAKLICIIGAESTGKTTLAQLLAQRFSSPWVPEYLRKFCEERGRPPLQPEQALIFEMQAANETRATRVAEAINAPYVFCDTAPLLTAIYSKYVFSDVSLNERAVQMHYRYALTLLLDIDIDWVADGLQRDGAHVREPVTAMIEQLLVLNNFPHARVTGQHDARLASAINVMTQHGLIEAQ